MLGRHVILVRLKCRALLDVWIVVDLDLHLPRDHVMLAHAVDVERDRVDGRRHLHSRGRGRGRRRWRCRLYFSLLSAQKDRCLTNLLYVD